MNLTWKIALSDMTARKKTQGHPNTFAGRDGTALRLFRSFATPREEVAGGCLHIGSLRQYRFAIFTKKSGGIIGQIIATIHVIQTYVAI
jgi:hypothetical protein